jgi:two-component system sensor histidine kinase DesK
MNVPAWLRRWMTPAPDSAVAEELRRGKSPWAGAVHLLWSLWIFLTPLFGGGYDLRWLLLTLLSYPLFLWLYAKVLLAPRRHGWRYAIGMAVLSLALLRWYPSGLSYFVFGCVMLRVAGRRPKLHSYVLQLLAMNAVYVAVAAWIGYPLQMWLWMPVMTLVIGIIINVEHASQEKDAALALSHDEVRRLAATAERERIGRDLHDLLGHTLSLITLKLELARKLADRDPRSSRAHMEEAERVAREALAQVRSAVTGIRSADLAAELASAKLMLESTQVQLDYDAPPDELPPDVERGLALVLREAVTNIARHAQAARARIEFAREAKTVQLCIGDDGRGGVAEDGNGLAGMRDRVRALGGTLSVESPRGGGTRLLVRLPLAWREPVPPLRAVPDAMDAAGSAGIRA